MGDIKVSIIIPIYNEESYLRECLDSVLIQTLKDVEILCIDDGSTDGSLQILQEYAVKDKRIQIFTQKNQYAGMARNLGMRYAKGQYLSFLDGDDSFKPDMLEKMYQTAENGKMDIVICQSLQKDEKTGKLSETDNMYMDSFLEQKGNFSGQTIKYAGIFQITRGWAWDKLFRTDFVRECGYEFPDFRSSEDGFFVYMLMAKARRMAYLDDTFVIHRVNDENSLSNTKERNWINGFRMLQIIKEEMNRQGIYHIYQRSFLNEVINFLKWYIESMYSFEVVKKCYHYIRTSIEPEMGVLKYDKEYYFQQELFEWYKNIMGLPLDEYLYGQWKEERAYTELLKRYLDDQRAATLEKGWIFPYHLFEWGKTIVLYGAGKIGTCYYKQLEDSRFCREIIWVDKKYIKYIELGKNVHNPSVLNEVIYDYIFIAIKDEKRRNEILRELIKQGIKKRKIKYFGQKNENIEYMC